jgi:hypothetical protein
VKAQGADRTIYKAFSATAQHWRETRLLKSDEFELLDSVRFAPVIFQEYIPAQADLRITMMGENVFAAAIYSQEASYPVDFRMEMGCEPCRTLRSAARNHRTSPDADGPHRSCLWCNRHEADAGRSLRVLSPTSATRVGIALFSPVIVALFAAPPE